MWDRCWLGGLEDGRGNPVLRAPAVVVVVAADVERTPVDNLLILPAGENTGLN
jgi:hypothetical protein